MRSLSYVPHVRIGGERVALVSRSDLASLLVQGALDREPEARTLFDVNGHGISLRGSSHRYRAAMDAATVVHADGQFIVWASRIYPGQQVPERSSTTDLMIDAARAFELAGLSFYVLGGTEEVNESFVDYLRTNFPKLHIAGRRNGYFSPEDEGGVVEEIRRSGADLLWVGLGKPKEQEFAIRNRAKVGCGWIVTCGGCYNYYTGEYKRAPVWMQRAGFEWLHRLLGDPQRFAWRYLTTNPHAIILVVGGLIQSWFSRSKSEPSV